MAIILIDDVLEVANLKIEPVVSSGPLLDAAYDLLLRVFDPAVVDPIEFYLDALAEDQSKHSDSAPIFLAAYFEIGGDKLVAGFNSSNLMKLRMHPEVFMLAVGNIATSPVIKAAGLRGVGTSLLDAAIEIAAAKSKEQGGELSYSVTEAEPASLGFWRKRGYLWPRGVRYLQPPLDFDEEGTPAYAEVPETLLVAPFNSVAASEIEPAVLRDVITTIYENWCLSAHRAKLAPEAMRKAEAYVMQRVLDQVAATIPADRPIPLNDLAESQVLLVD